LFAAVYKSPGRAWSDADIAELLSFRRKSILAGDLNAKHPFWNNAVPNLSGEELLRLFDASQFEISAPQCPCGNLQQHNRQYLLLQPGNPISLVRKFLLLRSDNPGNSYSFGQAILTPKTFRVRVRVRVTL
jgi:hypothetical protein